MGRTELCYLENSTHVCLREEMNRAYPAVLQACVLDYKIS